MCVAHAMMEASFVGRFECAICQGTRSDAAFCALNCGHCFHTVCVYQWLERSPTCPGCRASAKKRHVRALNGVDAVRDGGGSTGCEAEPQLEPDHHHQQQALNDLQQQLAAAEQHGQELAALVQQLESVQDTLKDKLQKYKHRCSELEGKRLQDSERLTAVNTELSKLKDLYKSKKGEAERLRQDLKVEQGRRAEADLRRRQAEASGLQLQLQNPSLSLTAMQSMIEAQDQDLQGLDAGQLLVTLARRNEQLSRAQARVAQLQEQLQQQQSQADAAQDAAHSRQVAADARAAKQQEECMKQVIQLEYRCNKLEQEKAASTKQLQELQGVLLALEGAGSATGSARHQHRHRPHPSTAAAGQQPASSTAPVHLRTEELAGLSQQGSSQKESDPAAADKQQAAAADDWRADAAAAVGPGSLLHRPAHIVQAPSFVKPGVASGGGAGLCVTGHLVRQGPNGVGGTARHLGGAGKRGAGREVLQATASKKARGASSSSAGNILSFFGKGAAASS